MDSAVLELIGQLGEWVLQGGGAGVVAYWLFQRWGGFQELSSEGKRYLSLIVSGALGAAAFGLLVAVGIEPDPAGLEAWLDALLLAAGGAAVAQQAVHGARRLRGRD